jgi:hypothetical protein
MAGTLRLTEADYAALKARGITPKQQVLPLGRRRKDTMTAAELRAQQPERDIRASIVAACRAYPRVAWIERYEVYRGRVLPPSVLAQITRKLHARASWEPAAVIGLLQSVAPWREFGREGIADLIGQLRPAHPGGAGAPLVLEVKRPGLDARAHQQAFLDLVTRAGGCAAVVCDSREAIERIDAFVNAKLERPS